MVNPIDSGLERLGRVHSAPGLEGLEAEVWARVQNRSQSDVFGGHLVRAQIAITATALVLGFLVSDFVSYRNAPAPSELSVLSDGIAPSLLLEGGA